MERRAGRENDDAKGIHCRKDVDEIVDVVGLSKPAIDLAADSLAASNVEEISTVKRETFDKGEYVSRGKGAIVVVDWQILPVEVQPYIFN